MKLYKLSGARKNIDCIQNMYQIVLIKVIDSVLNTHCPIILLFSAKKYIEPHVRQVILGKSLI